MNATEAIATISTAVTTAVVKAVQMRLAPGERCPFCGHKKGQRKVSEKMLAANRANIRLANDARRKK